MSGRSNLGHGGQPCSRFWLRAGVCDVDDVCTSVWAVSAAAKRPVPAAKRTVSTAKCPVSTAKRPISAAKRTRKAAAAQVSSAAQDEDV
eukprot:1497571-Rhodomonas_salina.3